MTLEEHLKAAYIAGFNNAKKNARFDAYKEFQKWYQSHLHAIDIAKKVEAAKPVMRRTRKSS